MRPKYNDCGSKIKHLNKIMEKNFNKALEEYNLTAQQARTLFFLIHHNEGEGEIEINQRDIEREFNLTNPTVSGILLRLEEKGYIQRITSQKDGRYKKIVVAPKTWLFVEELETKRKKSERLLLQGISEEEENEFKRVVDIMIKNMSI